MTDGNQQSDLRIGVHFEATPEEVYHAINDVRGWWGEAITGDADRVGGVFTFIHKDIHRSVQQVVELLPGKRVVWHVTDAKLTFVPDTAEWIGTAIIFDISPSDTGTELSFTHKGLVPAFQCYKSCSGAWDFLVRESLVALVGTGKGKPVQNSEK